MVSNAILISQITKPERNVRNGGDILTYKFPSLFVFIDVNSIVEDIDLVGLAEGFGITELLVGILYHPFTGPQESSEVDKYCGQQTRWTGPKFI